MKVSLITINEELSNLYINTGYYAHEVAEEMKEKLPHAQVDVIEMNVNIESKDLVTFLTKHKIEQ